MTELRARDLRNDLTRVLRRVSAGERLQVTLRGRPVAELVPASTRPHTMSWPAFRAAMERGGADPELSRDLANALVGDTGDVVDS